MNGDSLNHTHTRFCLALDCGPFQQGEEADIYQSPAYRRAKEVWTAVQTYMFSNRTYLSGRTMMHYGHFYTIVYGEDIDLAMQRGVFGVLDRYRQQHADVCTFVQLGDRAIEHLLEMRRKNAQTTNLRALSDIQTDRQTGRRFADAYYEQHGARVDPLEDEGPPQPIPPPFESVPFTRPKQREQQVSVRRTRSFLERYLTYRRLSTERRITHLARDGRKEEIRHLQDAAEALDSSVHRSRKYLFDHSAMAMIDALLPEAHTSAIATMPTLPVFIRFASPIQLADYTPIGGLFWCDPAEGFRLWARAHPERRDILARLRLEAEEAASDPICVLNLLDEDGDIFLNLVYRLTTQTWTFPPAPLHSCPSGLCEQVEGEGEGEGSEPKWLPCDQCQAVISYFERWFPVSLLAINGEFTESAESQEEEERETVREDVTVKVKRPHSSKYDQKKTSYTYRVVTFDASVKKRPAASHATRSEPSGRPSWLDLAVERDAVVYVNRYLGKSERELDPQRNPRWKSKRTVKVAAHKKRIPMTVEGLRRVITKVVARKYEQQEGAQSEREKH